MGTITEGTKRKNRKRKKKVYLSKEELKLKRRRERHRIVVMQRVLIAVMAVVVIGGGGFALAWNIPAWKIERELKAAEEYTQEAAFDEAIESCKNALKIDSTVVKAYSCMAGTYLDMDEESNAKQILYEGWENTQDESLLEYYCTVVLNEAVSDINNNNCTFETADKIADVLEKNAENEDALKLMDTAYERVTASLSEEGYDTFFADVDSAVEECSFTAYVSIIGKLENIYNNSKSEKIKNILLKYSLIDIPELKISMHHVDAYKQIVENANAIEENSSRLDLAVCLNKEIEVLNTFADLFKEFDADNLEAAKEFIVSDVYIGIRDEFIGATMQYWNGEGAIPVSREYVVLKQSEGKWTFEYPDFKQNENTTGVITVWGSDMKDNGIQRSCISYEPPKQSENYYPHIEYKISYVNSNVQKEKSYSEMLNYHLEKRTWTEDGMTTEMTGDWGGPYEWKKSY